MPCYRKDDRAMGPRAYGCCEKICESLATPIANFPDILMDLFRSIHKKSCGSGSADNRVRSPHTSGLCRLPCDAGISRNHAPRAQLLERGLFIPTTLLYNVTGESTIAVADNIDCQVQRFSTLILGVFPLHQIAHVGVSPHTALSYTAVKLFSKNSNLCDHDT